MSSVSSRSEFQHCLRTCGFVGVPAAFLYTTIQSLWWPNDYLYDRRESMRGFYTLYYDAYTLLQWSTFDNASHILWPHFLMMFGTWKASHKCCMLQNALAGSKKPFSWWADWNLRWNYTVLEAKRTIWYLSFFVSVRRPGILFDSLCSSMPKIFPALKLSDICR